MLQKKHRELTRVNFPPGDIGHLEKRAGVTDRRAFWLPYAKFDDGFQRCVRDMRVMAEKREAETASKAGWSCDKNGNWFHPDNSAEIYATAYDVVILNKLVELEGVAAS